jgi:hypothetical protein
MGMRKTILLLLVAALLMAGCSEPNAQQDKAKRQNASGEQAAPQQEKTVVVNEGMSEKEEEKLNERLAELEAQVDDQTEQETANQEASQPNENAESAEDQALEAARDYYAAAAGGNYSYTYSNLSAVSQGQFTEDEWVTDNTALGSDTGTYSVNSVEMVDDTTAEVQLTITSSDGSSSERTTRFVLENGSWKHELTPEEYELFAGATATASASASASASATANGNTKHVEIVITSNRPADVSISDDSFDWFINEEIVGTETYERDIAANSGLSVSATTEAYRAQTTIEVYENGELVAQDTDPNGFALVNY